jgi:hypothetical protein
MKTQGDIHHEVLPAKIPVTPMTLRAGILTCNGHAVKKILSAISHLAPATDVEDLVQDLPIFCCNANLIDAGLNLARVIH